MNRKDLLARLHARPFVPFRIHLTDGKTYAIEHPELVWVFATRLEIITPELELGERAAEDSDYVGLLHIVRIEPIKQAA